MYVVHIANVQCTVLLKGIRSDHFSVSRGFRQGNPLSTIFFKLVLEKNISNFGIGTKGLINYHNAGDIVLIRRSRKDYVEIITGLQHEARKHDLKIN